MDTTHTQANINQSGTTTLTADTEKPRDWYKYLLFSSVLLHVHILREVATTAYRFRKMNVHQRIA